MSNNIKLKAELRQQLIIDLDIEYTHNNNTIVESFIERLLTINQIEKVWNCINKEKYLLNISDICDIVSIYNAQGHEHLIIHLKVYTILSFKDKLDIIKLLVI